MHKNSYVIRFAALVTISCSVLLTAAATFLRERQQENEKLDMQKNILVAGGFLSREATDIEREQILKIYDDNIESMVLNLKGDVVSGKKVTDLNPKKDTDLLPLYFSQKDGQITSYIIPISGKGLWSTIYGYIALESDAISVKGITFYKHGETPGLGGEIEKDWFQNNFVGKRILSPDGELVSITVIKGKVAEKIAEDQAYHYVDGISGSTLTGNGLNQFLKNDLQKYEPYFKQVR